VDGVRITRVRIDQARVEDASGGAGLVTSGICRVDFQLTVMNDREFWIQIRRGLIVMALCY